ncbi:MAG: biotin--[acetyl-CoA-carboxylase] ligase [Syntrophobacterales bacterium]|nr:biotin--[acetyl-CoA-carboxylase] ligase [Syntrophobacterales bacterium]
MPENDAGLGELLAALRQAAGPVSGESLAARLGLSRTAIWKRVQRLKALGYEITGEPRRGYRLRAAPDCLLPCEILQGLPTRRFRGPVHAFSRISSTNDYAKELGRRGAPEGTLVVAEAQEAGRGRLGRTWASPAGVGLYVSLLLRPPLPPVELPRLTLTVAVAAARALERSAGVRPGIKWPNDLLLGGRKLAGILTELETEAERIRYLVVGLGLNVNTPVFPPELADTATSLYLATGRPHSRIRLLRAWLEDFEALYELFLARRFPEILAEWQARTVTLGRPVRVRQGEEDLCGVAVGVDPEGALLLQTAGGQVVRVTSGEVAPDPDCGPGA